VGVDYINSANAQQTDQQTIVTKAEAALAAKIKCGDFSKNANGTWTSGPNTKIGATSNAGHCPAVECEKASAATPKPTDDGERGSRLQADCAT
jgi:hypothetical protein